MDTWRLLQAQGIQRIVLVTHAWHMPRAANIFRRAGFAVMPAPTIFESIAAQPAGLLRWLPRSEALVLSHAALHEYLGMLWYRIRY